MTTQKAGFCPAVVIAVALLLWTGLLRVQGQSTQAGQTPSGRENRSNPSGKSNSANLLMQPQTEMLSQLKSLKRTGDPDYDYAQLIRIHDQAEADLLQQGMKTSNDPALATAIQNLVAQKEKEVNELRKIAVQIKGGPPNQAFAQQIDQKLLALELELKNGMNGRMTGDARKDFLSMLTQHQQDSIDLTESYLLFAKDASLKAYAQQLVENRRKEMEKMKAFLKS